MAAQFYKINYKSDFVLTINSDAGWAVPFCIKFWTGMPSQAYFAGFDGENYVNCRVGETPTQLLVMFDDHHMPIGELKMQIAYHTTIEEFPDRKFDEVTNPNNVTVDIEGTEYQVMLDFTGESGAEIDFSMPSSGVMSVNGKIGYVTLNAEDVGAQPTIEDLATIRSGAAAGATAVQPAELQEGLAEKQDAIEDLATIRSGAAAGSTAVQPAGLTPIESALQTIEAVIPSAASSQNQLADKNFVNNSISTNTANFVGTYNSLAELQAVQNPTNNDYGFVIETDAQGNEYYDRYKYVAASQQWLFEYKVESTPFTAAQWAAIQSGITSALVTKLNALPTNTELQQTLNGKADAADIPTALSQLSQDSTHRVVTDAEKATWNGKQNAIDDLATIRSGAAAGATAVQPAAMNTALADRYTKDETYNKNELNSLITTPDVQYVTVSTYNQLPATGSADTIYKVSSYDGTAVDATKYAEYAWDGSSYVLLSVKSAVDEVFDISVFNAESGIAKKYGTLTTALTDIPSNRMKGGMSIKFIRNSDNKYVQYRLTTDEFSIDVNDWVVAEEGIYVDNNEFIYVKTDAEGKIIWAIKADGGIYYAVGVPQQIIDYINERIAELSLDEYEDIVAFLNDLEKGDKALQTLLDEKVDKETGKSLIDSNYASSKSVIENQEFLEITTDNEDKILEGIKADGTKIIERDLHVKGDAKIEGNSEVLGDSKILGDMEVSGTLYKSNESIEFVKIVTDTNNNILYGVTTDGDFVFGTGVPRSIKNYVLSQKVKLDADVLAEKTRATDVENTKVNKEEGKSLINAEYASSQSATDNPEYLQVTTDSEGKLLAGRTPDGEAFENVGFSTPKVSVDGATIENIEDIEERTEIKTDSEGKIISYRDSDGVKHEEVGIESAVVKTNSLNLTDEGMTEFQRALASSGFRQKSVIDWSDEMSLKLPSPKCAKINFIISHSYSDAQIQNFKDQDNWPNILLPTTKTTNLECTAEYWDMLGNYFKKAAVLNAQGNSSMRYRVKNLTYDLDDGSEISFGGWVMQDSFHLKFYYQDFLKVYCIAGYRIGEELIKYKNCRSNRNKVGKNNSNWNFGATTDILENNVESGALCHPDGFGVEVYINGEYQGLYVLQLKKHRKNYDMNKKNYEEVLIDNFNSFTHPVWTDYEIKNPKTLICMDGTEYDDDAPKELIDSSSEFYDSTNKNHKNTVKTKNAILRLCSAMSTITSSEHPEEKFLEFFDKDMFEVYLIVIELLYGYDNTGYNWVISCFDGIWAPNFYDLDTTCGKTSSGTIIDTRSITTWIQTNAETHPLGFVWVNYKSEIVALWNELRNKKIIDADNLTTIYKKIAYDIGISSYERQYDKYPTLPNYRNSTLDDKVVLSDTTQVKRSDYWEVVREVQDWNNDQTDFDDTRMYVVGDTCKVRVGHYNHIFFRCKQNIPEAGLAPMTLDIYYDLPGGEPVSGGFYDSLNRIKKWFEERITFLDSQFINQ